MDKYNLRCSEVKQNLTYMKNRLRGMIADAEFDEIEVEAYELDRWHVLVNDIENLESHCEGVMPHLKVSFSDFHRRTYEDLIDEVSEIIEQWEEFTDNKSEE